MEATLDHLVVAAETLADGKAHLEGLLDIEMSARGVHSQMGTHNHLMGMTHDTAPHCYLETIAVDEGAVHPGFPRWFDLDNFSGPPRLTNWVLSVPDLETALAEIPVDVGPVMAFERGRYAWRMALPENGKLPFDGCFPALIEWQSEHPAPALPHAGLRLLHLTLKHPQSAALQAALAPIAPDLGNVRIVQSDRVALMAEIRSASGDIWIT